MQLKEGQREEVKKRIHRSASFQRVFSGVDGEFVLGEIDANVNYKGNTFDPDPYISAYKAGQRSIAIFVHTVLEQDKKEAMKLLERKEK